MATAPYILLVDDDPQNLFLLEEILAGEGYATQSATSGPAALALARQSLPQLILLDVMMPEMDGFEVCEQLRDDAQLATIPVIFLTALDDDASRLKSVEVMGDDYLTKPIQAELVLKKIASILKLTKLRSAAHEKALAKQAKQLRDNYQQYRRQMMAAWKISETLSEKFHLFVPEQFLARVAPKGLESIQVGNAIETDMTVLFCDIRNFTSIVEFQQARETFQWLNALFERINQSVMQHHGFVDKYLGDAVMAVFDRHPHHVCDALSAAVQICESLEQFNRDRAQFLLEQPLRVGIGVHTGRGIIGTVGANQRMDTTVVGDVVNTASRLEELTKVYHAQVLSSQQVMDHLPTSHPFETRWVDEVAPRGKQTKLNIYEVLGKRTDAPPCGDTMAS